MKSKNEVSAGGVVYRRNREQEGQFDVLICKASGYHRWVLPKGMVNQGETLEQTALREVEEEVGVRARIIEALGEPEKYVFTAQGTRIFKRVYYFLMEFESGDEQKHDHEMEEVRWIPLTEAIDLLEYRESKEVVRRAKALLEAALEK
jgi:8-oxo-dGTP pyrophosphatase MutT (NUDIX family)